MTVQELYENIGGNYDGAKAILQMDKLIERFIVKFLDDKSFERLSTSWAARDLEGTFEGAHAMKGVCGNLGLDGMSKAASQLAEEFRPGKERTMDDAGVDAKVEELRAAYEKTVAGIRAFSGQ